MLVLLADSVFEQQLAMQQGTEGDGSKEIEAHQPRKPSGLLPVLSGQTNQGTQQLVPLTPEWYLQWCRVASRYTGNSEDSSAANFPEFFFS